MNAIHEFYALGELCEIGSGGTPSRARPEFYGGEIPWTKIGDIEASDGLLLTTEETITQAGLNAIRGRLFPEGTLLFAIYGSIGKMAFAGRAVSSNQAILGIQNRTPRGLDMRYLFHWLGAKKEAFLSDGQGIAQKNLSAGYLRDLRIALPPLDEQRRIAAILDKADALRQKRKGAIALLDSLTQSIFLEMFGDPINNPIGRKSLPLRALVDRSRDISYGVVQRGPDQDTGVSVVRISDFGSGLLAMNKLKRTTPAISAKYPRTLLRGGEIVISIRGTVGRCAIVPASVTGANVSREVAVIPTLDPSRNGFYLALLRSAPVQKMIIDDVKGVAQSGINLEDLRQLPVIQPDAAELERFNNANVTFEILAMQAHSALALSNNVFASLQNRAFSGQL